MGQADRLDGGRAERERGGDVTRLRSPAGTSDLGRRLEAGGLAASVGYCANWAKMTNRELRYRLTDRILDAPPFAGRGPAADEPWSRHRA